MCDDVTRENLARRIGRWITLEDVVAALEKVTGPHPLVHCL
jgi:hypothetical protein